MGIKEIGAIAMFLFVAVGFALLASFAAWSGLIMMASFFGIIAASCLGISFFLYKGYRQERFQAKR